MQRRVDQADRDRLALHRLEDAVEVLSLERQQTVQGGAPVQGGLGKDHPLHDRQSVLAKEHVLGPTQPDPPGAECVGRFGLVGQVGIRPDAELTSLVRPGEELRETLIDIGPFGR